MAGTGSNTLVAKDVFVPTHRVLPVPQAIQGFYPAHQHAGEITDRWAFVPVLALAIVPPTLGMASAVLERITANAGKRGIAYTSYERQTDSSVVHHQLAEAAMRVDSAYLHALRAAADIEESGRSETYMAYERRARVRADCGWAGELVRGAIDSLMSIGGASGFADASVLQRIWRDANVSTRHAIFSTAANLELYGRALLGLDGNITPLI
jgi:alkylation response protein AidB-like acyl-CoA dehydrogenase